MKLSLLFTTALVAVSFAAPAPPAEEGGCLPLACCRCDNDWKICVGNCNNPSKKHCEEACRCYVSNLRNWCADRCHYPKNCPKQPSALFEGIGA